MEIHGPGFDVVGDVHGMAATYRALLERLGYVRTGGAWRAPFGRRLVQLGDLVDRGPDSLGCVETTEELVDSGVAEHVVGNHEFNAVGWFLGVRPKTETNRRTFEATLRQIEAEPKRWERAEAFLRTRPLAFEEGGLRFVHAAWRDDHAAALPRNLLDDAVVRATRTDSALKTSVDYALKGPEVPSSDGFVDAEGTLRRRRRVPWWTDYPAAAPPVFFGHYWLSGAPRPLGPGGNAICLDFACGLGGPLVAYRHPEGVYVSQPNLDVPPRTRPRSEFP
jgi:hypothetical protein